MELGYKPGEIKWAGYDLNPDTVTAIEAGYGAANVDEAFMYGYYGCLALYLKEKYDLCKGDVTIATAMVDSTNIADFKHWVELGIK
jgi:ABC-type sugar transport system substrate-binding protein